MAATVIVTAAEFTDARRRLGLSQRELAEKLDTTQTTVWRWEQVGLTRTNGIVWREVRRLLARAEARVRLERSSFYSLARAQLAATNLDLIEHIETCGLCLAEVLCDGTGLHGPSITPPAQAVPEESILRPQLQEPWFVSLVQGEPTTR